MRWVFKPTPNCQKIAILQEEIWSGHLQNKHRNVDLKTQKMQKTVNKGGTILGQVADNLIKITSDFLDTLLKSTSSSYS